jgi:hypothetical protein
MWYETFQPGDTGVSCAYAARPTAIPTGGAAFESFIDQGRAA